MKVLSIKDDQFWEVKRRMQKLKISRYHEYVQWLLDLEKRLGMEDEGC